MRDIVTTGLDLVGLLLVVAGVAMAVAAWSVPAAFGAAGVLLLAVSWMLTRRSRS